MARKIIVGDQEFIVPDKFPKKWVYNWIDLSFASSNMEFYL